MINPGGHVYVDARGVLTYRTVRTNGHEGGVRNSLHTKAQALDLHIDGVSSKALGRPGMYLAGEGSGSIQAKDLRTWIADGSDAGWGNKGRASPFLIAEKLSTRTGDNWLSTFLQRHSAGPVFYRRAFYLSSFAAPPYKCAIWRG